MKIKELVELLRKQDQEAQVVIAPMPFETGWTNDILPKIGGIKGKKTVVLGLKTETTSEDEVELKWEGD